MITTLGYQIKDLKQFVIENLEKRGYALAPGAEPKLVDITDLDDPETLAIEVLVEDRPIVGKGLPMVEFPASAPTHSPVVDPGPKSVRGKYKQDKDLTKEGLEKQEAKRARWRKSAQDKRDRLAAQKQTETASAETEQEQEQDMPQPLDKPLTTAFQQEILNSIEEIKRENQEVVAPAPGPFQFQKPPELVLNGHSNGNGNGRSH